MDKFTKRELGIFNLIKQGKSKNEILSEISTTSANFAAALTGIYKKTDEFVGYHTERSKFEELTAYLRNNPTMFSPIPTEKEIAKETQKENSDLRAELNQYLKSVESDLLAEREATNSKIELLYAIKSKFNL